MKRLLITLNFSLVCLLIFQSCSKDDTYINLSTEAKDLLVYEAGDTFQLKNIVTDEIITLTVNWKRIDYNQDSNAGWWLAGSSGDNYYEYGEYYFTDDSNCYNGTISVEARNNSNFKLTASLGECFGYIYDSFEYQDELLTSVEVNGINYTNIYLIKSFSQTIFYSKEKGIIKIMNNISLENEFTIYE